MEIVSQTQNTLQQTKKEVGFAQLQKCSFSGKTADFYIGLSGIGTNNSIRIVGAVCNDMVEMAIVKLLGQGSDGVKWPVILDMNKKLLYHSNEAHKKGFSAILGWKEYLSKL